MGKRGNASVAAPAMKAMKANRIEDLCVVSFADYGMWSSLQAQLVTTTIQEWYTRKDDIMHFVYIYRCTVVIPL